jgi:hypothetical protein
VILINDNESVIEEKHFLSQQLICYDYARSN